MCDLAVLSVWDICKSVDLGVAVKLYGSFILSEMVIACVVMSFIYGKRMVIVVICLSVDHESIC